MITHAPVTAVPDQQHARELRAHDSEQRIRAAEHQARQWERAGRLSTARDVRRHADALRRTRYEREEPGG